MAAVEFGPYPITKPGYAFAVYLPGTNTLASLFTDTDGLTAGPNPSVAGASGAVLFYAAAGTYDLVVEGGRFPVASAAGGGAPTGAAGGDLGGTYPNPTVPSLAALVPFSLVDAKGDLLAGTANDALARLAVGTDGQVLTADSTKATGVGWATPANAGTAAAMGYLVANDSTLGAGNFLVADGGVTNDGVIAAGALSTLTSAAAPFPTTVATQTVTLFQQFDIPDATIAVGTPTLLSAGNNFPAGIVAGMTVEVSGAGTGSVTLTTTVVSRDSAGQLTLAANAITNVATARAMKVFGSHQSVVTTRNSSSSLTLTTPAPFAFSAAEVSWGSDNRTMGLNVGALAKTQRKPIWAPPGDYNWLPTSSTGLFGAMTNMNATVHGVRGQTRFIASLAARPTFSSPVVQTGTGCFTDVKNWVNAYVGPPPAGDGSTGPIAVAVVRAGTADLIWKAEGIDSDPTYSPWGGIWQQAGTGTAKTRGMTKDCRLIQQFEAVQLFVNTGTDATFIDYGSKFETTWVVKSMPTDSAFHPHALYKHPSVGIATFGTTFRVLTTGGGAWCIHDNGTPNDTPAFVYHVGSEFLGNSQGVLVQPQTRKATFINCTFGALLGVFQCAGSMDLISPTFVGAYTSSVISMTAVAAGKILRISNPTVDFTGGSNVGFIDLTGAVAGSVCIIEDFNLALSTAWNTFASLPTSAGVTLIVESGVLTGQSQCNPISVRGAHKVYLRSVELTGTWNSSVILATGAAGTMTGVVEVENCDLTGFVSSTGHAPFRDQTATGTDGVFDIHDNNKVAATGAIFESAGRTGSRVISRRGKGADAAVANPLVLGVNGDHHDVTSSADTTVDNIYLKNANTPANSGTVGNAGDKRSWRHTSAHTITLTNAGNLRLVGAGASATVTQNQLVEMIGDGLGGWDVRVL